MTAIHTGDFPYTLGYITELLSIPEAQVLKLSEQLQITYKVDPVSNQMVFYQADIDLMREALEKDRMHTEKDFAAPPQRHQPVSRPEAPQVNYTGATSTVVPATTHREGSQLSVIPSGENLAAVVEAVSQAKESILKDLSRLLDDKLSGLDEVVVELIRCKSENDSLKQKVKQLEEDNLHLKAEYNRFKPVQFGFYCKQG